MLLKRLFRQKPGEVIRASTINDPLDAIEQALKTTYSAGFNATTVGGGAVGVSFDPGDEFPAKITSGSGSGPYAWTEQQAGSGGIWTTPTGARSDNGGADPAYNTISATPGTLPLVVPLKRSASGFLFFTAGSC